MARKLAASLKLSSVGFKSASGGAIGDAAQDRQCHMQTESQQKNQRDAIAAA